VKAILRHGQPNFFVPFDRHGMLPPTEFFEVKLRLAGTMRGATAAALTITFIFRNELRRATRSFHLIPLCDPRKNDSTFFNKIKHRILLIMNSP